MMRNVLYYDNYGVLNNIYIGPTRRHINLYPMFFADFSVNSQLIYTIFLRIISKYSEICYLACNAIQDINGF